MAYENDVLTRNDNDELAVRVVQSTEATNNSSYNDVLTYDTNGKLAVRVVGAGGGGDAHNKGYFATQSALETAYPTAEAGDYAIVGATDTVWIWDEDTSAWVDTDTKGEVTSVNGKTGTVVLNAKDVSAIPQYSTMPVASADHANEIVQYSGATNANYTNGYFYKETVETGETATVELTTGSGLTDLAVNVEMYKNEYNVQHGETPPATAQIEISYVDNPLFDFIDSTLTVSGDIDTFYAKVSSVFAETNIASMNITFTKTADGWDITSGMVRYMARNDQSISPISNQDLAEWGLEITAGTPQVGDTILVSMSGYWVDVDSDVTSAESYGLSFKGEPEVGDIFTVTYSADTPIGYSWERVNVQPEDSTQLSELPTADASNVGNIVQYVGVTDATYTNGFFYKSIQEQAQGTATITQTAGTTDSVSFVTTVGNTTISGDGAAIRTLCSDHGFVATGGTIDFTWSDANGYWFLAITDDGVTRNISDYQSILEGYGFVFTGTPEDNDTIVCTYALGNIYDLAVNVATFETQITTTGNYVFTYDGANWSYDNQTVNLASYGISYSGTPVTDDALTVSYTAGAISYIWTQTDVQPAGATGINWATSVDLPANSGLGAYALPIYTIQGGLPDGEYEFYWQVKTKGLAETAPLGVVTYNCRFKIIDDNGTKRCYGSFAPVIDGKSDWLPSGQYIPNGQAFYNFMYVMSNGDYIMYVAQIPWETDIADTYPAMAVPECFKISAIKNLGTGTEYIPTGELFSTWPSFDHEISTQITSQRFAPDVYIPQYHSNNTISYNDNSQYITINPNNSIANGTGASCSELDVTVENDSGKYHVIVENSYTSYIARVLEASGIFANTQIGLDSSGNAFVYLNTTAGTSGSAYVSVGAKGSAAAASAWMSPPDTFTALDILKVGETVTPQNLNMILQYTDATDANYTNGYFYKATGTAVTTPADITISNMSPNDVTLSISDVDSFVSALATTFGWELNYVKQQFANGTTLSGIWDSDNDVITVINIGFMGDITDQTVLSYVSISTTGTYSGEVNFYSNAVYVPAHTEIQNGSWVRVDVQPGIVATPPSADGTYVLKATVSSGVVTVAWVAE